MDAASANLDKIRDILSNPESVELPPEMLAWLPPGEDGGAPDLEGSGDPIEVTEDGVAREFTRVFGKRFRFDHDQGQWFEWARDRWRQNAVQLAMHFCRLLARRATIGGKAGALIMARKSGFATGVERFARADPVHAVRQDVWDKDPWLIGIPGGALDCRTGRVITADPAHGITMQTAIAPAETENCPRWLAFLEDATGGDDGMIRFLQQFCGLCLTGITREHVLVFIWGPGGNGKSVFINVVLAILADYATTAAMEVFTASPNDRHPTELAVLKGKRLVTASETEEGRSMAEARVKQLTGGDVISARLMRQDSFTFKPQFKLLITGNHRPALKNVDEAARRRFNIVPFTNKPTTPDPDLEEKLTSEWPGILRWMITGALDWQESGLVRPHSVRVATAEYFDGQDQFGQWLDEECTVRPGDLSSWETSRALFESWSAFARAAGVEPGNTTRFGESMGRRGFIRSDKKVDRKTVKVWCGLILQNIGWVNEQV